MSAALAAAEETIHIVQRGDTIYSLARTYGVNFQDILVLNGIDDARRIQIGQRIRIPGSSSPDLSRMAPQVQSFLEHRVVRGETLYGISRLYGLSLQTLLSANNLSEKYMLKTGDTLRIPQNGPVLAAPSAPAVTPARPPVVQPRVDEHYIESPLDISPGKAALPTVTAASGIDGAEIRSTVSKPVDSSVRWPIAAREIAYLSGKLNGVVLKGERNEPVRSLTTGVVISAGPYRGFGKVAIVQMTGGYWYVYGGCENLTVREGDRVAPGSELGRLGIDALSDNPQLFFLVYRNNVPVDPATAPRN
ncbi:LysM domain/M23/M37 peptidase domain protein [Treponema primitia ZAS-2]|uniref:LysM domain/M23/M37 peptidase domain protein n=1 Tax=Treponema primitia (strain ATCC BAA-887 / DSM 12427 / ZAS-2) TaxID=545694 RepID=F5YH34_TREPZ|nr:M23 family metallopeptidase [Treponema primitia]AEF86155.1 LysM domain/M23/M37 peptidase domain protein [Treponema primitia ZAS-2]